MGNNSAPRAMWCLLALLMMTGCGASNRAVAVPAVASVGGQRIDRNEMSHYLRYAAQFYSRTTGAAQGGTSLDCSGNGNTQVCAVVKRQVLARLLQEHVVLAYAAAHHISLSDADEGRVGVAMHDSAIVRVADSTFLRQVLRRQLLVQKVEDAVVPESARKGPSLHLRKFFIPAPPGPSGSGVFHQALTLATDGAPIPPGTRIRAEWEAPFRLTAPIRQALDYAGPGQYVGPFSSGTGYLVVQLVSRGTHRYGTPARNVLTTRYFRGWLKQQLAAQHPQCFDSRGKNQPCPI